MVWAPASSLGLFSAFLGLVTETGLEGRSGAMRAMVVRSAFRSVGVVRDGVLSGGSGRGSIGLGPSRADFTASAGGRPTEDRAWPRAQERGLAAPGAVHGARPTPGLTREGPSRTVRLSTP